MSRVTGVIYIDFETGGDITNEQFKKFKAKMSRIRRAIDCGKRLL